MRIADAPVIVCLLALSACAPPAPPSPPPSPPPPSEGAYTVLVPVPADDPRIVRCGVDDRPRSVVGAFAPARPARVSAEERAFLGDRAAVAEAPMQRPMVARPMPTPIEPLPPRPRPALTVTAEPAQPLPGEAFPAGRPMFLAPDLDPCDDLLENEDRGAHGLEITFASSGAPTEVRIGEAAPPSKFVRCAMERSCQLRAPVGAALRVLVPLVIRSAVAETPPPPPERAAVRVKAVRGSGRLRDAAEQAAAQCSPRERGTRIRVELELRSVTPRPTARSMEASRPVTRAIEGSDPGLVACTVGRLRLPVANRGEVVEITWNP